MSLQHHQRQAPPVIAVSRGEGELLTVPKPRAVRLFSVCLAVKPVGEPDALIGHVRFDERGWETERCRMAQATAPILDSTETDIPMQSPDVRCWVPDLARTRPKFDKSKCRTGRAFYFAPMQVDRVDMPLIC